MKDIISVVTAVDPTRSDFLGDAWASLRQLVVPRGWDWEWLVQEDGGGENLAEPVHRLTDGDPRVRYAANPSQRGAAGTRNLALERASGGLLANLDADDEYTPSFLRALLPVLVAKPHVGWAAGRTVYAHTTGEIAPYPDRLPLGPVATGWFADDWLVHDRPAAHPSAIVVRTEVFREVGGWMPISGSEDTGAFVVLSEAWAGWGVSEVVLHYRKWPRQTTDSRAWRDTKSEHYEAIASRLAAMRNTQGPTHP